MRVLKGHRVDVRLFWGARMVLSQTIQRLPYERGRVNILFSRQSANEELTQGVVRLYLTASQYSVTLSICAIATVADSTPLLEIKDLDVDLAYVNGSRAVDGVSIHSSVYLGKQGFQSSLHLVLKIAKICNWVNR